MFSANTKVTIKGLPELAKKLEPDRLLAGPVKSLLKKAAMLLVRSAKKHASGRPGPRVISGTLRSRITHEIDGSHFPLWAKVGSSVLYAPFVELGHLSRGGTRVRAYPFLAPALDDTRDEIESILGEAAGEAEDNFKK